MRYAEVAEHVKALVKDSPATPTVIDRVVQQAVRMVLEPIYEHRFAEHSYGFRPGR